MRGQIVQTTNYFAQTDHSDAFWSHVAVLADTAMDNGPWKAARAASDLFWASEAGQKLKAYGLENFGFQGYPDAEALLMKEALWANEDRDYTAAVLASVEQARAEGLS
jgi:hypothetical protein